MDYNVSNKLQKNCERLARRRKASIDGAPEIKNDLGMIAAGSGEGILHAEGERLCKRQYFR
jgi:hypothetical protein